MFCRVASSSTLLCAVTRVGVFCLKNGSLYSPGCCTLRPEEPLFPLRLAASSSPLLHSVPRLAVFFLLRRITSSSTFVSAAAGMTAFVIALGRIILQIAAWCGHRGRVFLCDLSLSLPVCCILRPEWPLFPFAIFHATLHFATWSGQSGYLFHLRLVTSSSPFRSQPHQARALRWVAHRLALCGSHVVDHVEPTP